MTTLVFGWSEKAFFFQGAPDLQTLERSSVGPVGAADIFSRPSDA